MKNGCYVGLIIPTPSKVIRSLTLKETKVALEGITVGGKTLKKHFQVINHRDAILLLDTRVRKSEPLSEWQLKTIPHCQCNDCWRSTFAARFSSSINPTLRNIRVGQGKIEYNPTFITILDDKTA